MSSQENVQPQLSSIIRIILISCAVIILPAIEWSLFGWLHMLLPLLALYIFSKYGGYTGKRLLLSTLVLTSIVFLLLRSIDLLFFAAILLLAGYVLWTSAAKKESPALSGLKTSATIALGWIAILLVFTFGAEASPYAQLVTTLDQGISEALTYYRQNEDISAETLVMLETTLYQMQVIVPIIMPAVLGSIIVLVTWFTMVLGNNLLLKSNGTAPWAGYGYWQLPERLIWIAIIFGIATVIPMHLVRLCGINGLILLSLIYCFQGLAIAVFYMDKWKVPILLRSFFYVMMILQSFGTIILLILGVADIWLDFRRLRVKEDEEQE